ncbi:MAG: DNA/RNA non-specific endonuclease [Pyrinomonadaceae bacterium]
MTDHLGGLRAFLLCLFTAAIFLLGGCASIRGPAAEKTEPEKPRPSSSLESSPHFFFGNPSNASEGDPDNYLIVGEGSIISYNNSRGSANWVAWLTTKADLGPSLRRPDFQPDPRLPLSFTRIGYFDYSGSGYDRGHMVPSADRFADRELNEETFLMTNIVPQTAALNQHPWEKFESFARGQARRGFDVYQIAGVYGTKEILKGKVAVPTNCWKLIVVMPGKRSDIGERIRMIAVDMPNEDGIEQGGWERFKTSIRAIEEKTGYDLFRTLPREIQDDIETRVELRSY